jgi:hypothetical protein
MDTREEKKVLFIDVEKEATYDLTVYYTDEELAEFDDASALKILLVDGQVINDADPENNYQYNGNATPNAEDGFMPMKELSLVQEL